MARGTLILCGLLSMGLVCQGQLNYEGNPLTEAIEYTAQESQSSRLNARKRFEVADARTINLSKRPFTPSAIDPLTPEGTTDSLSNNDDVRKYEEVTETTIREMIATDKGSPIMTNNQSIDTQLMSTMPSKLIEPPINRTNSLITMPQGETTRQLRQYLMQSVSPGIHRAPVFQEVPQSYHQPSRSYGTPDEESPIAVNSSSKPQNSISPLSKETIDEVLRARAEMQLQRLLTGREQVAPVSSQQSVGTNGNQGAENTESRGAVHDTFDNEISSKYENDRENVGNPTVAGLPSSPNQVTYLTRAQYQSQHLYPAPKWNQNGAQSRRDTFYPGPPMRRYPGYRDLMRTRLGPYAQQRIAPGPPVYLPKGLPYSGPPPPAANHHWKQPVEVIYKKPPGPLISKHPPVPISNPPVAYEDATKWFPESDNLPPQKDVYYSQLYAQSYDPHYYNYIAKTGKIKPWLYGKLGKSEEKSIWWELYSGFKNHGMKNMMNPMFLLGMTIPTLTLILSALMQKRSAARAYTGAYDPKEFFEVYEPQIRAAILAYENQMKENMSSDKKSEGLSRRKRSVESDSNARNEEQDKYDDKEKRQEKMKLRSIGPAPPGVSPFEEYFLGHQEEFAQAIIAYEKEQREKYEKEKMKETMNNNKRLNLS